MAAADADAAAAAASSDRPARGWIPPAVARRVVIAALLVCLVDFASSATASSAVPDRAAPASLPTPMAAEMQRASRSPQAGRSASCSRRLHALRPQHASCIADRSATREVASTRNTIDDETGVLVARWKLLAGNSLLVLATLLAPLLGAKAIGDRCTRLGIRVIPLLGEFVCAAVHLVAGACEGLRTEQPLLFVLLHAAATYACGDVIAQMQQLPAQLSPASNHAGHSRALLWQPMRSVRSSLVGILSDALPFYQWSMWLSRLGPDSLPGSLRGSANSLMAVKIFLHIVFFQTFTNAMYLSSQALLRGEGMPGALALLRKQLWRTCLVTGLTFPVAGILVYSLPSVALQSALRNAGVLVFAAYLAIISNA